MSQMSTRSSVIGSGPNGLAGAIVLAQAGLHVEVFEAEAEPGGAARTLPLTVPGFMHDFGSAVHPFAAGSPFFTSLPLADHAPADQIGKVEIGLPIPAPVCAENGIKGGILSLYGQPLPLARQPSLLIEHIG